MMALRAAALLLVLLALAACGGDDEEEGAAAGTSPAVPGAGAGDEYAPGGRGATGGGAGGTLEGTVGPGFEIALEGADGLAPGAYTLRVDDRASSHNFHLTGPGGVDVATSVAGEGAESFEVVLEAGEYTFLCDPHASSMRGSFTVG
jgi:hypothetical protein